MLENIGVEEWVVCMYVCWRRGVRVRTESLTLNFLKVLTGKYTVLVLELSLSGASVSSQMLGRAECTSEQGIGQGHSHASPVLPAHSCRMPRGRWAGGQAPAFVCWDSHTRGTRWLATVGLLILMVPCPLHPRQGGGWKELFQERGQVKEWQD